jgi:hypothetical protein
MAVRREYSFMREMQSIRDNLRLQLQTFGLTIFGTWLWQCPTIEEAYLLGESDDA